jgi:glycosyltransferase involved in cell wall biosynthesis
MRVWLVKLEERLPFDEGFRPYRMHMLAEQLVARDHDVVRWASDFDHQELLPRFGRDKTVVVGPRYTIKLLHSPLAYSRRVSAKRLLNNWHLARRFAAVASAERPPDIIVCSMPTPALAVRAVQLARAFGVPSVVDARDLWPNVLADVIPRWLRPFAAPLLFKMERELTFAAKWATGLVGITPHYRDHLLTYAGRPAGVNDQFFFIGYQEPQVQTSAEDDELVAALLPSGARHIFYFAGRINSTVANAFEPLRVAARSLQDIAPDVVFVICGDGDQLAALRAMAKGLPNVIFPGFLPPAVLTSLKKRATAGLLPIERRRDYQISLSNKVFEYMSAGLPVLSYLDGLPGRVLTDNGCGLVYSSSEELVDHVLRLRDDPKFCDQMGKASRAAFESKFTAAAIYSSFSQYLESLVND